MWFFLGFLCLFPLFGYSALRKFKRQHRDFPIRITLGSQASANCDTSPAPAPQSVGSVINSDSVERILVRENTGRSSDDNAMAQIYLLIRSSQQPILVNQHYLVYQSTVIDLAQRIADRIGVKLDNELEIGQ